MFRLKLYGITIPSKSDINNLIKNTTATISRAFANTWRKEAVSQLKGKAGSYISGIKEEENAVSLEGKIPEMMEKGRGPYDMKPFFARSSKRKTSKDGGWYMDIPFKSSSVPGSIMRTLSSMSADKEVDDGMATQSLRRKDLATYHRRLTTRDTLVNNNTGQVFPAYQRKSPIHEGVRRVEQHGGGQYFQSFRRVSSKSDPNSWIHPGFSGKGGVAQKAFNKLKVQEIVNKTMTEHLKNL